MWETLLAVDFDKWACATYKANFPGVLVECGPVADYLGTLPAADVLLGGPPCQPFSQGGKREGEADQRDCIPDYLSAVEAVRPRHFLMENVAELLAPKHRQYLAGVVARMQAAGYHVEGRELDAVAFGTPQRRERAWYWGIRQDLYAAGMRHRWPRPTHSWPPQPAGMFGGELLPAVTVEQALGYPVRLRRLRGAGFLARGGPRRDHPACEPFPTIGTTFAIGGGGGLVVIEDGPDGERKRWRMTPDESARAQGMREDFAWPADISKTERYRVIGNGWACRMAAVMAAAVRAADPASRTTVDLFCGGGLGACGWHGRYWSRPGDPPAG